MSRPGQPHCTFCDLIAGAGEVSVCYEDADAVAFMDIQPVNPGHVLVVPRQHMESLFDVPREMGAHLFDVTMRVANAVRGVTGCEDMNIVVNSGVQAGQDEMHYHVHIIPRRADDGFDIPLPFDGSEMPDRTRLAAMAARIGSALSDPMRTAHGEEEGGERPAARARPVASPSAAGVTGGATGGAGAPSPSGRTASPPGARRGDADATAAGDRTLPVSRGAEGMQPTNGVEDDLEPLDAHVDTHEGPHGELVRVGTDAG